MPDQIDEVVREIEALGFPQQDVRTLTEPATFEVTGVMSFPRLDFEVELGRELLRIGATKAESQIFVEGLKRGGALVLATGSEERVDAAAMIMNQHGAVAIEEGSGQEPQLPGVHHATMTPVQTSQVQVGRIHASGGGAAFFVW